MPMRRLAATLAGLALVMLPSAVAMSSADTAAKSAQPSMSPAYQRILQNAPASQHRGGRHCHRNQDGQQQPQSGDASGV